MLTPSTRSANLLIVSENHLRGDEMSNGELIENLNKAMSLELSAVIQYTQHSFLISGTDREVFKDFFRDMAEEAQDHADFLGDKIVALGGVPTVEPAMIRQSVELKKMLRQGLELERAALEAYMEAWRSCGDKDLPTKFWLEGHIADEQLHIEELERLTSDRVAEITSDKIVLKEVS
ncbi:MAG: ferritin-like domain-containing protein [Acidobacteria bacterium]|nr:MAG: ferritin-like domain-containing protein [Acidobacteriota bacterium]REK02262.1 MAG: ferritin-like domain-containing protein [Acidobacteriota bacterium]REK13935.1 MAG: ferritin-like domain-containing protein [Acidobacteriota bacterium]REK41929.1 MAG: ferritin-like domain-containing protein [Acidobacteriota bacterium]